FEVALCRVVNDVLERDVEGRRTELHREHLVRLVTQAIEERGVDGGGLFSDESCESGAFRSVSLACRAKTAKQMDLQGCRLRELVLGQLGCPLIKIVGDTHRADRVRARRSRP